MGKIFRYLAWAISMARRTKTAAHGQKKKDFTVTLTPEGVDILDSKAEVLGISRSELIEQLARGLTRDIPPEEAALLGEFSAS